MIARFMSFYKPGVTRRVTFQDQLTADDYMTLMKDELEDLADHRLNALINIEANKARLEWADGMTRRSKAKLLTKGTWCGS